MVDVTLNRNLLENLISEKNGGVDALRERWYEAYCHAARNPSRLPDRATFYRWRKGGLPGNPQQFLRLCGLLDVDPLGLLVLPKGQEAAAMQHLYRSFWSNQWGRLRALSFLPELFGHQVQWPPQKIAHTYYNRSWVLQGFSHDPNIKSNFFPRIEIKGDERVYNTRPQVYHFAYSQSSAFGKRWIQYGYVERHSELVTLMNIAGDTQSYEAPSINHATNVETWFGPGQVDFRVASLHSFLLSVHTSDMNESMSVRFA